MYAIPILLLVLLALTAVAWSPIFAVIVFVPLFVAFLAYVGMSRSPDEARTAPGTANRPTASSRESASHGIWGERD